MRDLNINTIRSIDKAFDILNSFTPDTPAQTIDEIMKHTKLPKSTAYRLLYTLEGNGVIRYDPQTLKYKPGFKLFEYSQVLASSLDIVKESEQILTELQNQTGKTVLMSLLEGDTMVYVFKRESQVGLKYASSAGERRPLTYGIFGRVLLAFLPDDRLKAILSKPLPKSTTYTPIDKTVLIEKLMNIRHEFVAVEIDETNIGVTGIGAPIFNIEGSIIAAIGVLGPTAHFSDNELNETKQLVKDSAQRISQKLGYSP
ncbi:IclR family transcriptional regulator [Ferviditalea candida]|uniref:IclR family transcriptional regulator n=1 Tax=Ferviditalea candida TaxID=3108399 RepID=A0ABU5ZC96_9BACL|nr:IclR family transcriptional regulator [Paenibacillaceae bacterium T2]